ncbi:MAG TPA: CheR family methyltransferase [Stenotrophobium sp.]|nr:CheR family methyltransferase [Stenotrophobium sp.]
MGTQASRTGNERAREFSYETRDFRKVCEMIYGRAGISLSDSKSDMVYSRLSRRLRALRIRSVGAYLQLLQDQPESPEWEQFTNALTTNLTSFFREEHHFDTLASLLRKRHAANPGRKLLVWSSASSTGEEPYSIAITAAEAFGTLTPPIRILATDIDTHVLDVAASGIYALDRIERMTQQRLKKFFRKGSGANAGCVRVVDALRDLITFRQFNLLQEQWPLRGPYDAIFCRNVMIYFDKPTQYGILKRMRPLLAGDSLLFCGHSESFFHAADLFRPCGRSVYAPVGQAVAHAARRSLPMAAQP